MCKKSVSQQENAEENCDQYFVSFFVVLVQQHGVGGQFSMSRHESHTVFVLNYLLGLRISEVLGLPQNKDPIDL